MDIENTLQKNPVRFLRNVSVENDGKCQLDLR